MKLSKFGLASLVVVALSYLLAFWAYPQMPLQMASHWNIQNQVDSYMPRFWGVFLLPLLTTFLFVLFLIIPKIDPKKANIAKFRQYFDRFIFLLMLFLVYVYKLTILWNLGYQFNLGQWVVPAIGILFFYIGVMISHSQQNWTIGIRTPWTLSSETVWKKTHELGGLLFKAGGILSIASVLVPDYSFLVVIGSAVGISIFLFIYSYYQYQKA